MSQKITIHCRSCRSTDVVRDAWAAWDEDAQEWGLDNTFDAAFCNTCEGETALVERDAGTGMPVSKYDLYDDETP